MPVFLAISDAPTFEVMITIELRKSTVRPWASVSRPCPRICRRMLNTSGCLRSRRAGARKRLRRTLGELTALVVADVAGGEPTSRDTECFSMRHRGYGHAHHRLFPRTNSASGWASSVFPTPEGPRKMNEPWAAWDPSAWRASGGSPSRPPRWRRPGRSPACGAPPPCALASASRPR